MAPSMIVSGDITTDHHLYEGRRARPGLEQPGLCSLRERGGALLLHKLVRSVLRFEPDAGCAHWQIEPGVEVSSAPHLGIGSAAALAVQHSYIVWKPHAEISDSGAQVWRTSHLLGYGSDERHEDDHERHEFVAPVTDVPFADLLLLDDAGYKFRLIGQRVCWHLDKRTERCWTVLKLSEPVARGDLWSALSRSTDSLGTPALISERFVCLISAADLRREAVAFRPGLSWERTVDEVRVALRDHPLLRQLVLCCHLVIVFSADGALWFDKGRQTATLVFDPAGLEGGWISAQQGKVVGGMSAMTGAIVRTVARWIATGGQEHNLVPGIQAGLAAMRDLQRLGHGLASERPQGFPVERIAKVILGANGAFADTTVPWCDVAEGWSIAETSQYPAALRPPLPTVGLARQIAIHGRPALRAIPHVLIGSSIIIDRPEIEALRGLRRSMEQYSKGSSTKPFSVGVFGPPGAGKSFGVKALAKDMFGETSWLEFNLSQFNDASDLRGAFHSVRDVVLSGRTPVVFWDEFDANEYYWLRHLLAPMQDGRFQDGPLNHSIGKAIFVFAGGTSERFADFGPALGDTGAMSRFRLLKGPDFISRLDAFYDVSGPNQRRQRVIKEPGVSSVIEYEADQADVMFPVRRALLIRHHLGCKPDEKMDFDSDLLDALLVVPRYRHGSRSLEKIVQPLRPTSGRLIRRSALPSTERLQMHVDAKVFHHILSRLERFRSAETLEAVAEIVHAEWLQNERVEKAKSGEPVEPDLDREYAALAEVDKDVNRAAARRIPEVLALAGMTVATLPTAPGGLTEQDVNQMIYRRLEVLAEAEHDGWVSHRVANGWTKSTSRNRPLRQHEMLIPYVELPSRNKAKDRKAVLSYWQRIQRAGFHVVWLTSDQQA